MKKLMAMVAGCILSLGAMAQVYNSKVQPQGKSDRYCAILKDGRMVMTADGRDLVMDVMLENGIRIKTNGSLMDKEGKERFLNNGECVDKEGNSVKPVAPEDKTKKEIERRSDKTDIEK